jgi:hypothetical protein
MELQKKSASSERTKADTSKIEEMYSEYKKRAQKLEDLRKTQDKVSELFHNRIEELLSSLVFAIIQTSTCHPHSLKETLLIRKGQSIKINLQKQPPLDLKRSPQENTKRLRKE